MKSNLLFRRIIVNSISCFKGKYTRSTTSKLTRFISWFASCSSVNISPIEISLSISLTNDSANSIFFVSSQALLFSRELESYNIELVAIKLLFLRIKDAPRFSFLFKHQYRHTSSAIDLKSCKISILVRLGKTFKCNTSFVDSSGKLIWFSTFNWYSIWTRTSLNNLGAIGVLASVFHLKIFNLFAVSLSLLNRAFSSFNNFVSR